LIALRSERMVSTRRSTLLLHPVFALFPRAAVAMLGYHIMNMMVLAGCSLEQVAERSSACSPPKQKKDRTKEYEEYRSVVAH